MQDQRTDLVELWSDTLARADQTNPHVTVRPSDPDDSAEPLRFPSSEAAIDGRRPASVASVDGATRGAALPRSQETGLEDVEALVTSRDRYFLGSMLGRGGMGVVVQAVQRTLGRTVAVKIARYDLDRRQRDRFRTEAKCTAWLEHPNIVPVYEAGRNYLVMRHIVGSNLEEELAAGRLDLGGMVEILIKVSDAVSFAHHRGIIHRDIKPENILVGRFGEVMLTDWGLALTCTPPADGVLRAPEIGSGRSLCGGTPGYMAPEIALADRGSIGFATDVFLLGATLYRCLSGGIPFPGQDVWQSIERSAANAWSPLGESGPARPKRLIALQERAMAADPRARPSVQEFQAGLREWLLRSRAEAEALGELEAARRHLAAAQGHRLHPHEAYLDFSEAIAACDRAHALNQDLAAARELRTAACNDFALAAVGAGEPQLARLIKRSGRLPILAAVPPIPGGVVAEPGGQSSAVRRIASLLPSGTSPQAGTMAKLLAERQRWRKESERLGGEAEALRGEAERLRIERDALLGRCAERLCHVGLRRRMRIALVVIGVLLAAGLALLLWR